MRINKAVIRWGKVEDVFTLDVQGEGFLEEAVREFMFDALFHYEGCDCKDGNELDLLLYKENGRLFTKTHQQYLYPKTYRTDWEILLEREERLAKCELEMWLSGSITANELTSGIYDFHGVIPSWIDTTLQGS